jgi:ABC-type multidrug transport system fused ATPase/permease subunit
LSENLIKTEVDSQIENFFTLLVIFHALVCLFFGAGALFFFTMILPAKALKLLLIVFAIQIVIFMFLLWLKKKINCYYLISPASHKVEYIIDTPFYKKRDTIAAFDQIELVSATGIRKRTTRKPIEKWYSYSVCLLLKDGRFYEFARENKNLTKQNNLAEAVATITGCRTLECKPEQVIDIKSENGRTNAILRDLPIDNFFGKTLAFESQKQLNNAPVIIAAFFIALTIATTLSILVVALLLLLFQSA